MTLRSPLARLGARLYNSPYLLLTVTNLFWAGNVVLGRFVAGKVPPVSLACVRWACATLILLPFAWPQLRTDLPLIRRNIPLLLVLAGTGIACYNAMSYYGLQYTQAINGLLLQSAGPLLIAVWSLLLFRDRLTLGQAAGITISLLGVVTIVSGGDIHVLLHLRLNMGDVWILVALLIYAFYAAILRRRPQLGPLSFLTVLMGLAALLLSPFAAWEWSQGAVLHADLLTFSALAYAATAPSLVAYLFFNRGVELIGANQAAPFLHLMPVFGSVLAIVLLGERFAWYHAAGYALVITGIFTATRARRAPPAMNAS